jgi:hypothetical protein
MSQNLNFSVAGLFTSLNDFNGLPPGAMDVADNVEIRFKNVMESRRGFDGLTDSALEGVHFIRMLNFYIEGTDRVVALTSNGDVLYYTGTEGDPWPAVPGSLVTNITAPDSVNGKSRFYVAGQNLYLTAEDGVRSLSSGSAAQMIRAGVPKALNLEAETNGDESGFFDNNEVLTTTGDTTTSSALLQNLDSTTGITTGMYVAGTGIPAGTTVSDITAEAIVLEEPGDTTAGSTTLANIAGTASLAVGMLVSGDGIQEGTKIANLPGGTDVTLDTAAYKTATDVAITFSSPVIITMSAEATATDTDVALTFYSGAQVGYRIVYGRVETDINGTTITRLGSPSPLAIATNTTAFSTNVTVTATLPKNASDALTFVRLYRTDQTDSIDITPLDQLLLVYEANLEEADFTARTLTIEDSTPDSLRGIPLYSGSDQEGSLQTNDPPPSCWDICKFRDFVLYGNITQPSTLDVTIVSVGGPTGIQVGDTLTVSGSFVGNTFSSTYTAATGENAAAGEFEVVTSGTPSQNINDTAASLIRVINYDESAPVHAILVSSSTDLPGQLTLEADYPSDDTFFATSSGTPTAYDPTLTALTSDLNSYNNGIAISKSGELEAVPPANLYYCGDSSADVWRMIPLRDYVVVLKEDGIYKGQGQTPGGMLFTAWDLTTKPIGVETAVPLNSAVMMLSSQGVVNISDGGVDAKSIPIDDQLNVLIGTYYDNLINTAFAVGYESDRKYILCVPESANEFAEVEYNFNYITSAWTTWSRNFYTGFISTSNGKLYVAKADPTDKGVSVERKTATYTDFVDEAFDVTITDVDGATVTLSAIDNVEAGDILYQSSTLFSPILSVDLTTNEITLQAALSFTAGAAQILQAFPCTMTWKQVVGDNPAFTRQFPEGLALFKDTSFNMATISFVTDFSQSSSSVDIEGSSNGLWGLFAWGDVPWGGSVLPKNIRFLIPQDKQLGSYLIPTMVIQQGYSDFKFQGLAISYYNISQEVGR